MPDLLWKPPAELTPGPGSVTAPSRLGQFLGLSAALHLGLAALAPWLVVLMPSRPDDEVVRTIDFFPAAEGGAGAGQASGPAGAPALPAGPRRAERPRAIPRAAPARDPASRQVAVPVQPAAPVPTPTPTESAPPATGDIPVRTPKVVAGAEHGAVASSPPRPTTVASPVTGPAIAAPAENTDARLTALVRELAPGGGGDGPRATVAIPRELTGPGGGAGAGRGAGKTSGTGTAAGPGAGGGARGPGAGERGGGVDAGDPDFTEYFRTIERRVRAAWQFPRELQGTTQTVKLGFALRIDGTLEAVRVLSSTSATLNESAQSAMQRATPFPPLPVKFRALAGQPLVMSFTVTVQ
jgi:TonB family protein